MLGEEENLCSGLCFNLYLNHLPATPIEPFLFGIGKANYAKNQVFFEQIILVSQNAYYVHNRQ